MTNYYVYNEDGKQETPDERPTSGFYYEQDDVGGEVTLCEIDPQTGDRVVVETFEAGEAEYLVTEGGQAYEKTVEKTEWDWNWTGSSPRDVDIFAADTGQRRAEDDPDSAIDHYGIATFADGYGEYAAKKSSDIYAYNEETGRYEAADYGEFPLKIWVPKGTDGVDPSPKLVNKILAANFFLGWLSRQMGTGDINRPEYIIDSEGKKKDLDEYLDAAFFDDLDASGETAESEVIAANELSDLVDEGDAIDEEFGAKVLEIDRNNHEKYAELFNKVSAINEAMVYSLMGMYSFEAESLDKSGTSNLKGAFDGALTEGESRAARRPENDDVVLTDPGIQNIVEELELYDILARGMADCTTIVDQYAAAMEALAEEHPDQKHKVDDGQWHAGNDPLSEKPDDGGGDDGDGNNGDDGDGNNGDDNNGGDNNNGDNNNGGDNNGGNNNGGNNNGGNNNGDDSEFDSGSDPDAGADTDTEPTADPDSELEAVGEEFSNILGGSDSTPEGSATEDLLGGGEEDKPPSLEDRVMEYINGDTGSAGGGVTQAQAPAQPQQPGMDPSTMMMAPLLANAMGGQGGPLGGGEKGEDKGKGDDDPRRDQDRQVPGPPQQSPGVPVTADPGAVTAQPAVAAPTDTGAPPIISTPGATVDWPMPGDPETKIKVPQSVSDALTRQQGNPAIDAGTAYAGTPGEQTVEKPWQVVDVSALRTGDVIAWENHSAVVVDNGNGPHYLENGRLVPLNQSNLDHPQYGKYQNYFHPTGLDAAGGTNMQVPEAPTAMPEPKITTSQPPEPPPIPGPEEV